MPEQGAEPLRISVTREASFARFFADNAAALVVGNDIEFSFMVGTPSLSLVQIQEGLRESELTMEAEYVELCRVRMTAQSATSAAFNVIFALLSEGKVDSEKIRSNIESMILTVGSASEETKDAN